MPSGASSSSERWSPADVALVCTTRSHPPAASSGTAKPAPSAVATAARDASTSTSVTRTPGNRASRRATQQPTIPAPTTATRSPTSGAASHRALTAVSTVPASTARAGGTSSGTTVTAPAGTTYAVWCGYRQKTVRPRSSTRPPLDGADVEVAVLDRPGEVAFLERRAHRGVLARRHAAPEHQRLGAAADAGPQRADHDIAPPRLGQRDRPDLTAPGRAEPERVRVVEHVLCLGFVRHLFAGRLRPSGTRAGENRFGRVRSGIHTSSSPVHAAGGVPPRTTTRVVGSSASPGRREANLFHGCTGASARPVRARRRNDPLCGRYLG